VAVARRWLTDAPGGFLTVIAFPAVLINAGHGQNGFLTAALLGGGLLLIERRPLVAGALLGALVIKPQIALALPILVLASGRWRVMAGGIASAVALCLASWLAFGPGAWTGFFDGQALGRAILERGFVEPGKMVSVFAALRVLGAGSTAAYAAQAVAAAIAAGLLMLVCRRCRDNAGAQAAACAAATPLISPFFLDYDLTLLAFPLAWLFCEGRRRGFRRYEKPVLVLAYVLPLIARPLALDLGVPIAPLLLFALLALIVPAVCRETPRNSAPPSGPQLRLRLQGAASAWAGRACGWQAADTRRRKGRRRCGAGRMARPGWPRRTCSTSCSGRSRRCSPMRWAQAQGCSISAAAPAAPPSRSRAKSAMAAARSASTFRSR
jgi:hypothetical protein